MKNYSSGVIIAVMLFFVLLVGVGIIIGITIEIDQNDNEQLNKIVFYELTHNEYLLYKFHGYYRNYTFEQWYTEALSQERNFTKEVNDFYEMLE